VAALIEQHGGTCQIIFCLRQRGFYLQADISPKVIGTSGRRLAGIFKLLAAQNLENVSRLRGILNLRDIFQGHRPAPSLRRRIRPPSAT
jgi:hypothetical protein